MVWRQLIWFHDCQWHQFWLRFADKVPNFQPAAVQNCHGLAPIGHQEPVSHCNTTYQIHIDDIQWSGGNSYGFMTANGIRYIAQICHYFLRVLNDKGSVTAAIPSFILLQDPSISFIMFNG
jgi:hypothetical protein